MSEPRSCECAVCCCPTGTLDLSRICKGCKHGKHKGIKR
jgi:hypothetical protein